MLNIHTEQIQESLFKKYYSGESFSESTSSHWREYGRKTKVIQTSDGFDFNAYGISQFVRKNSIFRSLKHLPIEKLLDQMLKKHHGHQNIIQTAKTITTTEYLF